MTSGRPVLTVLLPARNAAHLLPDWLASVAGYADAVTALDDGSTDRTRSILAEHPLVSMVLTNPVRPTYEGWDDLANRRRLVHAALAMDSQWLLFLDADESIDERDGRALRHFLTTEAQAGFAYGFEVFRMVGDENRYDPRSLWVFRLFSAVDAVTPLGSKRLHFVPVPSGIPRHRWLHTSVRIRHVCSLTPAHRQAKFEKYLEADPGNELQADYAHVLEEPAIVERWPVRSERLPVLLGPHGRYVDHLTSMEHMSGPVITAVVIAQNDVSVIDRSVDALLSQELDEEFEIILVCSGTDGTFERVQQKYPSVRSVQLPGPALPGEARNAGLWMARGEYIQFPGSHCWLLPGSLAARVHAHEDGWDMVTSSVANGNTTRAGWASYFLDHSLEFPSRPSGEYQGAPGNASYVTGDVRSVGGFPEDMRAGEDTVVIHRLFYAGKRTYFRSDAAFVHASPSSTTAHLLRHHFQRGRALGRIMRGNKFRQGGSAGVSSVASLTARRLRRISTSIQGADQELRTRYGEVHTLVVAGVLAASVGTWFELLRGPKGVGLPPMKALAPTSDAPILAVAGRPGEAAVGLLGAGAADQSAGRLRTFVKYARSVCEVRPALAPIVTSATVTAEHTGTYTIDLPRSIVYTYLRAVRDVGASLLLQVQPGRAPLAVVLQRWEDLMAEPDVGVFFDLRNDVASADQRDEVGDAVKLVRSLGGPGTVVLVRGARPPVPEAVVVPEILDLRQPGTLLPHDALAMEPRPRAIVYQ